MTNPSGPPTAFDAITSFGVPTMGMSGAPFYTGNWWFVNETTGSDGNAGTASAPLKTLGQALTLATNNNNDVVAFMGTIHVTATLVWNKQVHLIGMCAPLTRGKRARISVSGSTPFTPMVSVTSSGCHFRNFGTFYAFSSSATNNKVCWSDTGGRSCYDNVEFLGFGDDTVSTGTANQTAARALSFNTNTGESSFYNCVFGVDSAVRNVTNYTVEIAGGAPRMYFENCTFEADLGGSGTASSHVLIGSSGIDRYIQFQDCKFSNFGTNAMAQAFNVSSSAGGNVLLTGQNTVMFGDITAIQGTPTANMQMTMVLATTGGGIAHEVF